MMQSTVRVLSVFLAASLLAGGQSASVRAPSDLGHFEVRVILSKKAERKMLDGKETIIVGAMFSGKPKRGATGHYYADGEPDNLGVNDIEIPIGGVAKFGKVHFEQDRRNRIDKSDPRVLINVFSGRKSSAKNLLTCDDYEGSLKKMVGQTITISCQLIGEMKL